MIKLNSAGEKQEDRVHSTARRCPRRSVIKRAVGWLKSLRRPVIRGEKRAVNFNIMPTVALMARRATRHLTDIT